MEPELPINPVEEESMKETTSNNSNAKEKMLNKPTPFTGDRKSIETFLQECQVYLQINKKVYDTNDDKIAFILSHMNKKEALRWKQMYLRSIIKDGEVIFPTLKEFIKLLEHYFRPANQVKDATHQLNLLRQGKKTAEETITEF